MDPEGFLELFPENIGGERGTDKVR
uniref:Uncharacterized protein n=1 Tax=Anguilla anguilla TaxID=7936 RepID=A0A0E9TF11_ANGAN